MSTSSPAIRNCGSKPPIASQARPSRRPCCSRGCARRSRRRAARGSARRARWRRTPRSSPSSGGGMFGPPMPACELFRKAVARWRQPVRVGTRVGVDVGDDLARSPPRRPALRALARPLVLGADQPEAVLAGDLVGRVGRAVVDDDHLVVRVLELAQAVEAAAQRALAVVGADDHRDPRPVGVRCGTGVSENAFPTVASAGFGVAVAVDEAERPVLDVEAAAVPLVGPGEHEHPGAAARRTRCAPASRAPAPAPPRSCAGESRPVSVTTSGRSPAMFWSRAR